MPSSSVSIGRSKQNGMMEADGDAGRPHDGADHLVDAAAKAAADAGDGWFSFSLSTFLLGLMGAAGATIFGGLILLFYFQRMLIYPRHVPPVTLAQDLA